MPRRETKVAVSADPVHDDQLARWLELTRTVLPAVADAHGWPIRLDHCFMRVFLDNALGGVWHEIIPRPAIRHIAADQLGRAIDLAERVLGEPGLLPELNRRSLRWRQAAKAKPLQTAPLVVKLN